MKIKPKVSKISLVILMVLLVLILGVFSLQTIYYGVHNPIAIKAYFVLVISIFLLTNYLLLQNKNSWFPILLVSSFLLGYMPYENNIPNGINLITSSEPQLSGLAEKFGGTIGVFFDLLFYPLLHFILLSLSKMVLSYRYRNKST